jgi:hypothetical protein
MKRANRALALALSVPSLLLAACGGVTRTPDGGLCTPLECDAGLPGPRAAPAGAAGAGPIDDGLRSDPPSSETIMLPCTVCARAEACCKAQGHTDCNYAIACASASPLQRRDYFLALCRAALAASETDARQPPDSCAF